VHRWTEDFAFFLALKHRNGRCELALHTPSGPHMSVVVSYCLKALVLMVNFGAPNIFVKLWFELDYGTNLPLGTLMI
jgi:hypothetical protein